MAEPVLHNIGQALGWYDELDDDYYCVECGADDVLFVPHNPGCSEKGDIVKRNPGVES